MRQINRVHIILTAKLESDRRIAWKVQMPTRSDIVVSIECSVCSCILNLPSVFDTGDSNRQWRTGNRRTLDHGLGGRWNAVVTPGQPEQTRKTNEPANTPDMPAGSQRCAELTEMQSSHDTAGRSRGNATQRSTVLWSMRRLTQIAGRLIQR